MLRGKQSYPRPYFLINLKKIIFFTFKYTKIIIYSTKKTGFLYAVMHMRNPFKTADFRDNI